MIIILPISINLILCILLFIVYCVHVLYVRFDMCKINESQSVSQMPRNKHLNTVQHLFICYTKFAPSFCSVLFLFNTLHRQWYGKV